VIIYERIVSTALMSDIKIDRSNSFQSIIDPMVMRNDEMWVKSIIYMKYPARYQKKFDCTLTEIEYRSILIPNINTFHIFSYTNVLKIIDNCHFIMFWHMWNLSIDVKLTQLSSRQISCYVFMRFAYLSLMSTMYMSHSAQLTDSFRSNLWVE
jgi:hypothetical protein